MDDLHSPAQNLFFRRVSKIGHVNIVISMAFHGKLMDLNEIYGKIRIDPLVIEQLWKITIFSELLWMVAKSCTSWKRWFIPLFIGFQPSGEVQDFATIHSMLIYQRDRKSDRKSMSSYWNVMVNHVSILFGGSLKHLNTAGFFWLFPCLGGGIHWDRWFGIP